jgi:hypothetical protein
LQAFLEVTLLLFPTTATLFVAAARGKQLPVRAEDRWATRSIQVGNQRSGLRVPQFHFVSLL